MEGLHVDVEKDEGNQAKMLQILFLRNDFLRKSDMEASTLKVHVINTLVDGGHLANFGTR